MPDSNGFHETLLSTLWRERHHRAWNGRYFRWLCPDWCEKNNWLRIEISGFWLTSRCVLNHCLSKLYSPRSWMQCPLPWQLPFPRWHPWPSPWSRKSTVFECIVQFWWKADLMRKAIASFRRRSHLLVSQFDSKKRPFEYIPLSGWCTDINAHQSGILLASLQEE